MSAKGFDLSAVIGKKETFKNAVKKAKNSEEQTTFSQPC